MEINRSNVYDIVNKCGLNPDKDYGQNFLLETSIQERIVDLLELSSEDYVLEIGPGLGSLSHFLALKDCNTDLVDIDRRMIDFLNIHYAGNKHISIIENDIRKHDVEKYTKVLGNLPYNITTETIIYLMKNAKNCKKMVLMCQAETFNHFFDTTGKEYGPASILIHNLGQIKKEFIVKPGSFYPCPKCNSVVFTIQINKDSNFESSWEVYEFSKKLFLNRRKTIYNNLNAFLKDSAKSKAILSKTGIQENLRSEQISVEKFNELFKFYNLIK